MKKTLALILALAMSCTMLAACGEEDSSSKVEESSSVVEESSAADDASSEDDASTGDDASSEDEPSTGDDSSEVLTGEITLENETPVETDERLFEALMNTIAETGNFTVDCKIEADGLALTMYLTSDGTSTYVDMDFLGMAITVLSSPDGDYILDTAGKKYYLDTTGSMGMESVGEEMIGDMTALDGVTYSSTATATMNGEECTVEKYINNDTQIEVSYVFNAAGDLVVIGNDGMYMPFAFKATADTSKLTVDGYTEMTEDEFMTWYSDAFGMSLE